MSIEWISKNKVRLRVSVGSRQSRKTYSRTVEVSGKKDAKKCTMIYSIIALVFVFLGTLMSNDLVWELTDMFNNLMVLPNAIALFALTGLVVSMTQFKKNN